MITTTYSHNYSRETYFGRLMNFLMFTDRETWKYKWILLILILITINYFACQSLKIHQQTCVDSYCTIVLNSKYEPYENNTVTSNSTVNNMFLHVHLPNYRKIYKYALDSWNRFTTTFMSAFPKPLGVFGPVIPYGYVKVWYSTKQCAPPGKHCYTFSVVVTWEYYSYCLLIIILVLISYHTTPYTDTERCLDAAFRVREGDYNVEDNTEYFVNDLVTYVEDKDPGTGAITFRELPNGANNMEDLHNTKTKKFRRGARGNLSLALYWFLYMKSDNGKLDFLTAQSMAYTWLDEFSPQTKPSERVQCFVLALDMLSRPTNMKLAVNHYKMYVGERRY